MVEAYFGLRHRSFQNSSDTAAYYPSGTHERARALMHRAINEDEGLALLFGEAGCGKTLLCHRLIEDLGKEVSIAFLTNSHFPDRAALLQAVLFDLSLPYEGRGEQDLRLSLTDYVLRSFQEGRRTLLVVDEAQNLSADLLEELRLLGNLEAGGGRAVHVILAAQPQLLATLRQPELAGFSQRLAIRAQIEPLGLHEAVDYLVHRIRLAGGRPERIITDEALELLARGSRGLPRLLNQGAHQACLLAQAAEAEQVDAEAALEALEYLGLEADTAGSDEIVMPQRSIEEEQVTGGTADRIVENMLADAAPPWLLPRRPA